MADICIGIHVHAEPHRLRATLASLRANTSRTVDVLLLPDGPDEATRAALADLPGLPQSGSDLPLGPPACFNRLAAASAAPVVVLLESGAQVGPGWLDHLRAALDADPRHGLAGPSTNLAWNEQGAFPHAGATPAAIARTADAARRWFGAAWRTLEPLHSLADFCYAVRREVVQAIGAADEAYGLGPCWEMDYNLRAARAGFRGVWACAAYVHRAPFTARRRREEALRFEANKHRYQDKFCALRLRGERADYEAHCRGEACQHFAPAGLIQVNLPLVPAAQSPPADPPGQPAAGQSPAAVTGMLSSTLAPPLVSCLMPSCGRAGFVRQSVEYFLRQDYPARELIIVDDGAADLSDLMPADARVRYVRLPPAQSIGAKRNQACRLARGEIMAQWDDDDWYAPSRLSAQVAPLLAGEADLTGLAADVFCDLPRWAFWRCTPALHRRLFAEDVHGGTLVFRRRVWEQLAQYPHASLAEDAAFLRAALRRGARLHRLPGQGLFMYVRHDHNAWSFACGQYLDPRGWQRMPEPPLPPADRAFYAARSPAAASPPPAADRAPRVTCIMPTTNRRWFVPQAIHYFLRQDYANRELIVVDDGSDAVADLIPLDPRIRYLRLGQPHPIGAKRNLACEAASGDLIAHWDDDDWMAPWRLTYQVEALLQEAAEVCGLDRLLYFDGATGQAWQYVYPGGPPWVAGNTLAFTRMFWQANPFPNLSIGEDNRFVWCSRLKRLLALPQGRFYVALIHPGNVSPKLTRQPCWQPYPASRIQELMGEDWAFYAEMFRA